MCRLAQRDIALMHPIYIYFIVLFFMTPTTSVLVSQVVEGLYIHQMELVHLRTTPCFDLQIRLLLPYQFIFS